MNIIKNNQEQLEAKLPQNRISSFIQELQAGIPL
jgi:hypothetical protein